MQPSPAGSRALLRVHDLTLRYTEDRDAVLSNVAFTVHAGEVVLVLGPSGSGKSTLSLALNGLIPHDIPASVQGDVWVGTHNTRDEEPATLSAHVAMVFQDPDAQQVTGSLLDEVAFGPENLLVPRTEVLERAETALRRVGLWTRRFDNPDLLSGGGKQRLAIACALAMQSPVLVLDEPTANLDPAGAADVYDALRDIASDGDRAVVIVEHNLDLAIEIATRVLVLDHDGRIAYDGAAADVLGANADALLALGVWLPTPTLAALHLRAAGVSVSALPLTGVQLREALPPATVSARERAPQPTATSPAIVSLRNLTLSRGDRSVLRNVDVDIPTGSFTAIIGGNSAGKTTLAQAIAGVLRAPKGTVRVEGIDPARVSPKVRASTVGFVFQNPEHQFVTHSVEAELAFELRRQKLDADTVRRRVDEMLDRFGLTHVRTNHPFMLSGGQKRRLSVGTALMSSARVLVLDEPTFGQDRARANELVSLLRELNRDGTTIVMVTHDMQLVAGAASNVIVVQDGRIAAHGAPQDVFSNDDLLDATHLARPALARLLHQHAGYDWVWDEKDLIVAAGGAP